MRIVSRHRWRVLALGLMLAVAWPAAAFGAANPAGAGEKESVADEQDVERLIATLEDPEARSALITDLKALIEANRSTADDGDGLPDGGDLLSGVTELLENAWRAIVQVDPLDLLTSIGISLVIVVVALLIRWLTVRLLRKLYGRLTGRGDPEQEPSAEPAADGAVAESDYQYDYQSDEERRGELPRAVVRVVNLIVGVLTVALIAETWGAGFGKLLQTDLGARIVQAGLAIGLILVFTLIAWHVAGIVVARLLTLASGSSDAERTARRLDTLVPLLRSVLQGIIGVLAGLLILSELGIDIGPLLAGAGILGLAVGFGAQTLVKDLLTGVTILLEDGATIGDVVEVAGHIGVVEEMSIRTMRLRDLAGAVHLVPYSEVTTIINYTQDYSYFLTDVGVAYREDTDQVCEVLTEIAAELRQDPDYRAEVLEDLEILGVDKFADSAVLIRARLKTQPGQQWRVGREFNRRMKRSFDERGIEIPFPHTTLYFGEPKEGLPPPARVLMANAEE